MDFPFSLLLIFAFLFLLIAPFRDKVEPVEVKKAAISIAANKFFRLR